MRWFAAMVVLGLLATGCGVGQFPVGGGRESLFTPGDLPDVPRYPGAEQRTDGASVPALLRTQIRDWADVEFKRYTTPDPVEAVSDWYLRELPRQGWSQQLSLGGSLTGGVLLFRKGDSDTVLGILAARDDSRTEILIVRGEQQG